MKVPFIDFTREYRHRKAEIDQALQGCLEHGDLIMRDELVRFEREFAEYVGAKHCIGTGSCTNAMFIALKALGVGPGDEVITVAHTFVATVDVIVACGASPVLVDVDWDTMVMQNVENAISEKTKAIMPVNLNGVCASSGDGVCTNIPHIIDSAQTVFENMPLPTFACFSFFPAKLLGGIGEGGAVVTNSDDLVNILYRLRDHGILPPYLDPSPNSYKPISSWGHNTILDNTDAAVLRVKLEYLDESIDRRKRVASLYTRMLEGVGNLTLPSHGKDEPWQNYVIRTPWRDPLKVHLATQGVETLIHWPIPIHKQPVWLKTQKPVNLPITEDISATCLSLPCYAYLNMEEQVYICNAIRSYFNEKLLAIPERKIGDLREHTGNLELLGECLY